MERGADSQRAILGQQFEHDVHMRTIDFLHNVIAQGAKGLGVLNAGAAVAMLAFVQSLVGKPAYPVFKTYALSALVFFLLGAFLTAIVFFFHHAYINHAFQGTGRASLWRKVVWGLLIASTACGLVGGGLVTLGIGVAV